MPVQNAEVAAMFDHAAELLEIKGENQFRVRAYCRVARVIEGLPQSVKSLLAAGRLASLPRSPQHCSTLPFQRRTISRSAPSPFAAAGS
jgi:DNA polymerase/3'-5' exonuclease PolX